MPKKLSAAAKRALASAKKNRGTKALARKANKARKGMRAAMQAKIGVASGEAIKGARAAVKAVRKKKGESAASLRARRSKALLRSGRGLAGDTANPFGSKRKDIAKSVLMQKGGVRYAMKGRAARGRNASGSGG